MKELNIKLTSYLFAFVLIFGTMFIAQCDRDTQQTDDQYQTQQDLGVDDEDRRYDGTDREGITGDIDHTLEYDNRDDLVSELESLRDDLDDRIEDRSDEVDTQRYEQMQNDRTEVERVIREVETATQENWNNVRMEAIQTYERIAVQYDEQGGTDNW